MGGNQETRSQETLHGLSQLWEQTLGDPRIMIAVLDGPADLTHPALSGAKLEIVPGVVSLATPEGPAAHHGTHVSSIIFGQHGSGVDGVAPVCRGILIPVFSDADHGIKPCSEEELAQSIHLAVDRGAHVVNVSGGRLAADGRPGRYLGEAIRRCESEGVLVVAAAGNDGCECHQVPAALDSVIAVGAATHEGAPLDFSNWGPLYRDGGILAAGQDIAGAIPGGGIARQTGTSFAAPAVSGVASLLMSLQLKNKSSVDSGRVRAAILEGTKSCEELPAKNCDRVLAGQIDVGRTLTLFNRGASEVTELTPQKEPQVSTTATDATAVAPTAQESDGYFASVSGETVEPASATAVAEAPPPAELITPRKSESPIVPASADAVAVDAISPSACGCGGAPAQLVYALGKVGYDFGTQARYDSFLQYMRAYFWREEQLDPLLVNPNNPEQMVKYLKANPESASDLIWTLKQNDINLYAIQPSGAFASQTYSLLEEFLEDQITLVSVPKTDLKVPLSEVNAIPGYIQGSARLYNGQVVQSINPDYRGMANWNLEKLVSMTGEALASELAKSVPAQSAAASAASPDGTVAEHIRSFLSRIYYEFENMGVDPADRALNYAGTNLWEIFQAFWDQVQNGFVLSTFVVEPSKLCRPDSSCWDVKLTFFYPQDLNVARNQYLLTIDVSDVVPVELGLPKHWSIY